jgi:Golgi phosphoprotein 3
VHSIPQPTYEKPQPVTGMTSTGLSRRRVAATTNHDTPDGGGDPSPSSKRVSLDATPTGHAGSALEGGSKIAFDPRDVERDKEELKVGGKMPRLTLMEEVLLLGIKDKQVPLQIPTLN